MTDHLTQQLLDASCYGDLSCVEKALAGGADIGVKDVNGWTPLHWAAARGHDDIAEKLIAAGADIEVKDVDGWTPLHWAAAKGRANIVEKLIAAGANPEAGDENARTSSQLAERNGYTDIAAYLLGVSQARSIQADLMSKIDERPGQPEETCHSI